MNKKHTILIVDDEKIIRKALERILQQSNFETDTARDGKEALEKCSQNKYDLILLDVLMPEMNGILFMKELKKINYSSAIIITTACIDNQFIHQAQEMGIQGLLRKPFDNIEDILTTINKAITT